MKILHNVLR